MFAGYLAHFWFIWLLIIVYAFVPIINKWIQKIDFREIEYFLGLWILIILLASLSIPFCVEFITVAALGFVILGYYLRNKKHKFLEKTWLWLILFILATCARIFFSYKFSLETGKNVVFDIDNIITVVQTVSIFLIIKNFNTKEVFTNISSFFNKGILASLTLSLTKYSFGIYLIHMLILRSLTVFGMKLSAKNPLIWIPLATLLILFISWGLLAVINRIPVLKVFSGEH